MYHDVGELGVLLPERLLDAVSECVACSTEVFGATRMWRSAATRVSEPRVLTE